MNATEADWQTSLYFSAILPALTKLLRSQTVRWIGAQFWVYMFLDFCDKFFNVFLNVNEFQLQNFRGFHKDYQYLQGRI